MNRKKGIKPNKSGKEINQTGQSDKVKQKIENMQETEDVTKYGEFVSSYFSWITPDRQKENGRYYERMMNCNCKKYGFLV